MLISVLLQLSFCLHLFNSYCICTRDSNNIHYVNSSTDLEQYLCNTTWSSQYLVFLLNSSVSFTISSGNFCQVTSHQTSRVEIRSNSPTKSATISCFHNDVSLSLLKPRRGLVFFNSTVVLKRLVFKNCGTYLTTIQDTMITDYLNSSSLYYTSSHAAALVFVHCQVNISQVNIYYSYGFAMIGINLYNSTIDSVNMSNSTYSAEVYKNNNRSLGSGFLLHFMDTNDLITIYNILIRNAFFLYNLDYNTHGCLTDTYYNKFLSSINDSYPVVNAVGLTILYTQQSDNNKVTVHVTKSTFHENIGNFAGGIFILQHNTHYVINTSISLTFFNSNYNLQCHGSSLVFYQYSSYKSQAQTCLSTLSILNTLFDQGYCHKHTGDNKYGGAVYIGIANNIKLQFHVNFRNCTFQNNYVTNTGACLYASVYQFVDNTGNVSINLDSTIAVNNSQYIKRPFVSSAGIFYFYKINRVDITGTSHFSNNYGSVISSQDSNVYLSGNLTFNNNYAMTGPAIRLVGNCQLYFMSGVIARFTDNSAQLKGGAIYADGAESNSKCVIQIDSNVSQIVFSGNDAKRAGSSIYAQPIFSCYVNKTNYIKSPNKTMAFYNQHFTYINSKSSNNLYNFSTLPQHLKEVTSTSLDYVHMFPGQEIHCCISALDALNRNVFSTLAIVIIKNHFPPNIYDTTKVWLDFHDQEQLIQERTNCTKISVSVHANDKVNIIEAIIIFSQYSHPNILSKSVHIYPCPLGFDLNNITGVCELSPSFNNLIKHEHISVPIIANITNQMITRPLTTNFWAGITKYEDKTKGEFGVSIYCPIGFCNNNKTLAYFYSGDLLSIQSFKLSDGITDYHPPLCLYQREGTLCGRCSEGLSVVFGSTECHHCSNAWIATITIYLVTGPLLIYLLYVLRLTLTTGTLNGIIFYAQAANCGLLDVLRYHYFKSSIDYLSEFAIFIISLLNLKTGFPLCLYNGMTELWKAGLNLAFPIYLLIIVFVLIIYSHFSLRLSNRIAHYSVQVLVTVIHLSFSGLLVQLINVMTYAVVYTSNTIHHVWFFDGTVEYGGHSHRILMTVTLIIVLGLLLPYVLLLLFAKPLRPLACTSKYLRPFLEAIHAPYKEGKQYWFTLRLLLLCAMYGIYSRYRATDIYVLYFTTSPMLVAFLLMQAYIKPFKNKLVHILDSWMMINLTFHYLTNWYFLLKKNLLAQKLFTVTSVFLTFVTLMIVITYHVLWAMGKVYYIKRWIENKWEKVCLFYIKLLSFRTRIRIRNRLPLTDSSTSFYGSCSEFREPVLNYND